MAKALTAKAIENLKAGATRYEKPDGGCAGLYLVVQPTGVRSWAARYRLNGRPAKLTLGRFPAVSLAEARRRATAALQKVAEGTDPAIEKRQTDIEAADRRRDTVRACFERYAEHAKKRVRESSWTATAGIFRRDILPAWGNRSVHDIRRRDVIDVVEAIAETRPIAANRTLAALGGFFRWLMARDVIAASPASGVAAPGAETERTRKLSDEEIARFWTACDAIPVPYGDIYRLLLLLGARRSEIAELPWSEINEVEHTWLLPAERSKNHEARLTPLPRQAWEIIVRQPRDTGSPYVFARGRSGHSAIKSLLDAMMRPDEPWVVHDLRRTCASGLQKLGIPVHITEAILGHKGGTFKGIVSVYQQHEYAGEKAGALQAWADRIDALVRDFGPNHKVDDARFPRNEHVGGEHNSAARRAVMP
jgi:integrase